MPEDSLYITGGCPLRGEVTVSGSKNGALPVLAATLLAEGEYLISNLPLIEDVFTMAALLRALGLGVDLRANGVALVRNRGIATCAPPLELVQRMRASFWVAGPLLGRCAEAEVPLPGGCDLGSRPVNFHIEGFRALGAEVTVEHGCMRARGGRLRGTTIYLEPRYRSPGATYNLVMAAVLAEGETTIENAAEDPEVVSFCEFLQAMGANLQGVGTGRLVVQGVSALEPASHRVLPDRLEAGTFLIAAGLAPGDITVHQVPPAHLAFVLDKLEEAGLRTERGPEWVRAVGTGRPRATHLSTAPFPLFPTDLQAPMVALLCLAEGTSVVEETIYDGRLTHVDGLRRMGAEIKVVDQTAVVTGVPRLTGATVRGQNIRAAAALVLAALAAEGGSEVIGLHSLRRGYENFEAKLQGLGAEVRGGATAAGPAQQGGGRQRPHVGDVRHPGH